VAREQVGEADIQLYLFDLSSPVHCVENRATLDLLHEYTADARDAHTHTSLSTMDPLSLERNSLAGHLPPQQRQYHQQLVLLNKSDRFAEENHTQAQEEACVHFAGALPTLQHAPLVISCESGAGLAALTGTLTEHVRGFFARGASHGSGLQVTRVRHRELLERCIEHLLAVLETDDLILATEELRRAAHAIGQLTGRVDVEEVLGVVFAEFCIGK
jgi:tRNA U34 5-carboxymethylaminomethyl modifying GTPase MnmE/TrmE